MIRPPIQQLRDSRSFARWRFFGLLGVAFVLFFASVFLRARSFGRYDWIMIASPFLIVLAIILVPVFQAVLRVYRMMHKASGTRRV